MAVNVGVWVAVKAGGIVGVKVSVIKGGGGESGVRWHPLKTKKKMTNGASPNKNLAMLSRCLFTRSSLAMDLPLYSVWAPAIIPAVFPFEKAHFPNLDYRSLSQSTGRHDRHRLNFIVFLRAPLFRLSRKYSSDPSLPKPVSLP